MLDWKDGQPFSDRFGDVYFSADSGLEEKRHVFLQGNDLPARFSALSAGDSFCVGETGFGTGLNFLCTWLLFERTAPLGASLDFFSVEKFPLDETELRSALVLWPELQTFAARLSARWHRRVPGWNRWSFAGGRVRLTLAICDVGEALSELPEACVDVWFLDGFSPDKNPDMWSDAVMTNVARASRTNATLSTYTSAGWVRRGLQQVGFGVEKAQGFGSKREMVKGRLVFKACSPSLRPSPDGRGMTSPSPTGGRVGMGEHSPNTPPKRSSRTAIVIGGGIAGCAAAHALAQRGMTVTIVDRSPQLASGASGNQRGILHARFSASDDPLARFVLAAYGHALGLLDEVLLADGVSRSECGLLQLACNAVEQKRITRLAEQEWPEHLMRFVDAAQAGRLSGVAMQFGGLWFPAGGWVVPPELCARLVNHAHITQRLGHEVAELEKTGSGWSVNGEDIQGKTWREEAEIVLVCCAHAATKLAQFVHFPLTPVRGQITVVPETAFSKALQAVVCGDGYCAPAVEGMHVTGATHTFEDESTDVRDDDHAENLANLAAYAPDLYQTLSKDVGWTNIAHADEVKFQKAASLTELKGRASIRCSAPGSMPLVGKVQEGLYCSLAHGTRGLLTAGIAGEVLATQIFAQLPPLPASILRALAPLPRIRKQGKSAT